MAKVDIVIPCYNYGRFLEACVASVLDQSLSDLRILIIDDASSDDSVEVANRLAAADERIQVIAHARNQGHIETYNQGIAWAGADYFLLLSADDMLVPGALSRAAAVMDAAPDVVLTHGKCIGWRDDLPFPRLRGTQADTWSRQDLVTESCAYGGNLVHTPTAIVRTSTQKEIGGYRASLPHSADMEMWLRFSARGTVARLDSVQAIYRRHAYNMSNVYYDRDLGDLQQRKQAFDCFFSDHIHRIANGHRLRQQASCMLARKAFWSGVIRFCRGQPKACRLLLRLAFELDPTLRYRPPLSGAPAAFGDGFQRLVGRLRRVMVSLANRRTV